MKLYDKMTLLGTDLDFHWQPHGGAPSPRLRQPGQRRHQETLAGQRYRHSETPQRNALAGDDNRPGGNCRPTNLHVHWLVAA